MLELIGKYNKAIIYTDNIEETAVAQIIELCNQEFSKGSQIRIMPDVHAGAGCTIGTTMTIVDKVVPNLVGVDIGCGMFVVVLDAKNKIMPKALDFVINKYVPAGFNINDSSHLFAKFVDIDQLKCVDYINTHRAMLSVGTLGGGWVNAVASI